MEEINSIHKLKRTYYIRMEKMIFLPKQIDNAREKYHSLTRKKYFDGLSKIIYYQSF